MKKLLLLIAVISFSFSAQAQVEATSDQYTILAKKSADWCPLCGGFGWNMLAGVTDRLEDERLIPFAYHHSGGLKNDASEAIHDLLGGSGQPLFFLNTDDINVSSNNVNAKIDEVFDTAAGLNSFSGFAGVGIDTYLNGAGDELKVYANVKFFANLEGEYYLGLYLIQDNFISTQAGQGSSAAHKNLLTHSFFDEAGGKLIVNGAVTPSDDFNYEATLAVTDDMVSEQDMSVIGIIWNKTPNGWFFFNAGIDKEVGIASSTKNVELTNVTMKAFQSADQLNINIATENQINKASLQVVNMNGQVVYSNNALNTIGAAYNTNIDINQWTSGTYIVQLITADGIKTNKVNVIQ